MGRPRSWRKTVVIGAGPVGSLAALYAANRGDEVEVYELRSDLRDYSTTPLNFTKSINLALSERGINALRFSGYNDLVETIFSTTIPMHGRMIHTKTLGGALKEEAQAYDVHGRFQRSVDRNELNKCLLDKLDTMPNVKIFFQQKLIGADFRANKAWFEDLRFGPSTPGHRAPEHEVSFDLMIGADGAHSAVRYHMMKFARIDYSQQYIDCLWCEFSMDSTTKPSPFPDGYRISPNHLHIWPSGSSMFIALPSHSGRFVCTLFGTASLFSRLQSAAASSSTNGDSTAFLEVFDSLFPGVTTHISPESLLTQFRSNPHLPLQNIKCTPHHFSSSAVILGDAANAMVPFYGQGMNAGLESVRVLFETIDDLKFAQSRQDAGFSSDNPTKASSSSSSSLFLSEEEEENIHDPTQCLAAALRTYTLTRTPDAHAIADLALGNYAEMASGVVSRRYKVRKWVEETLDKCAPRLDWKTQYARVSFGNERYSDVTAKAARQGRVLDALVNVLGAGVVAGVAIWVWRFTRLGRR